MQQKGEIIAIVYDELSIAMELMIWILYLDKFLMLLLFLKISVIGISLVVRWLKLCAPRARVPGWVPGQGTKSHMLQLKVPCAAAKAQHSHIK